MSSLFSSLLTESATLPAASCGPDLEYAPQFLDFIASAQGKAEQQLGSTIVAAQPPDWRAVLSSGSALATQTRDLRIATVLTHAATEVHGLRGLTDGLALILDWLTHHWETLHPVLAIDGEPDPLMRSNALAYLYAPTACVRSVRQTRLLESRAGDLTVGEVENIALGRTLADTAPVTTHEQLTRLIADESARNEANFAALHQALTHHQAIAALWKSKLPAEYWPDFDSLGELLERLTHLVTPQADVALDTPAQPELRTSPATQPTPKLPDAVANRREAFQILALAREYFERHEPSHPAPLLIQRIERLEPLSFAEIVSELTPDGLNQLRQVAGQQLAL